MPAEVEAAALNGRILSLATPPASMADLPIGPGDLIEVSVFAVEELSRLKLRVPILGTITLPLLGQVRAAGRTAIELEDDIRELLRRDYMHDPQVSVFIHEHKSQRISIIGAVSRGGIYGLSPSMRMADALALAEGLTAEADHFVYLVRHVRPVTAVDPAGAGRGAAAASPGGTVEAMVAIDLEALANGREELNVSLQAGDVIHVPKAGSFYVGGAVERPGSYLLKTKTTVQQAILSAGGPKDVAEWQDIRIYRPPRGSGAEQTVLTFDLNEFEKGQPVPEIQRNDVIIVGKSASKAFLYGFIDFVRGTIGISKGL